MSKIISTFRPYEGQSATKKAAEKTGVYRFKGSGGVTITVTSKSELNRKTVDSSTKKK